MILPFFLHTKVPPACGGGNVCAVSIRVCVGNRIGGIDDTSTTVGIGFTTTVAVVVGPGQPLADGVIVKVTVIGAKVVLVKLPLIGVPDPLAGIPVTVATLSRVHV